MHVWGEDVTIEFRTVDGYIKKLRAFIEPLGLNDWIETIRGMGYRYSPQG